MKRLIWIGFGMVLGAAVTSRAQQASLDTLYAKLEVFAEVLGHIENHYVDAVSPTQLIYSSIRGALFTLDPHSNFFTAEEYKSLLESTEGEYGGLGIELGMQDEVPEVLDVYDGSPAQKAGVVRGDRLLAIDDEATQGISFDGLEQRLKGPVGSKVVVRIGRGAETLNFTLIRGWIRISPIAQRSLDKGVLYVAIKSFSRRVGAELQHVLVSQPPPKALVLDLRGNPGGLFDEAVEVCDLFLRDGPIVAVVGRGGRITERYVAHEPGTQPDYKIAVLIDRGSASAAEIVAGGLQDRGRARVFGATSYGKGSVQSIMSLTDGSGLKLTVARYVTPSGKQIDGAGVTPDETTLSDQKTDEALAAALKWLKE